MGAVLRIVWIWRLVAHGCGAVRRDGWHGAVKLMLYERLKLLKSVG